MSDQMRQLSNIKWQATGVDGHTHHTCGEWMYTSDAPPVEADEYERMKRRAEAAEKRVQELTAMLNGQERLARENAQEFDKVFAGLNQGLLLSSELYRQWQDATARAEAAELSLKLIEADNRDLIEAHRRIGELERALADEREGHAIDNDEGAEIIINLMGDVQLLTEQLAAAIKRAEAAEAAIAAVPRQAIDALFRQQFGSYPVWFNEMWTPIADWLGYKPARR